MTDTPTVCPICGSTNLVPLHGPSWTGSKEEWHIVDCLECGAYWKRGDYMDRHFSGEWFDACGDTHDPGATETNVHKESLRQRLKRSRMAQNGG